MRITAAVIQALQASNIASAAHSTYSLGIRGYDGGPYCETKDGTEVCTNDCGIEQPTTQGFMKDRFKMIRFFAPYYNEYVERYNDGTLEEGELTIPAFMARRLAPNMSPSAIVCDGHTECLVPSCEDFGEKLTKEEKQMAWYFFEFFSILDQSQKAMYEGTNEFFNIVNADIRNFVQKFSYADEQQTLAQMREQRMKLTLALIMSITLMATAATGGGSLFASIAPATSAGGVVAGAGSIGLLFAKTAAHVARIDRIVLGTLKWAPKIGKQAKSLDPVAGIINSAYISLQNLAVNFDPKKDLNGFDKLIDALQHTFGEMQEQALARLSEDNLHLMTGGVTRNKLSLLTLFGMGRYQAVELGMSLKIRKLMKSYHAAMTINVLWQREGAYVIESQLPPGRTCVEDDRGHFQNRVCLAERPNIVYWIYAMGLDEEDVIRSPPGFWELSGSGYEGLTLEDVVRSCLWKAELWNLDPHANVTETPADIMNALTEELPEMPHYPTLEELDDDAILSNNKSTPSHSLLPPLKHYGIVPGTFVFGICRDWSGLAISSVNIEDSANAPCICDDFRSRTRSWRNPAEGSINGTNRFVMQSELHNNKKWGHMCRKEHKCKKEGTWKERLNLPNDVQPVVEDAWSRCKKTFSHDKIGIQLE